MEKHTINELRQLILPILLYCQANKGDLMLYHSWKDHDDASKKLFYAYYSGLFCRILYVLESDIDLSSFVLKCNKLLNKYNWYDIQANDLELFKAAGPYGCEVREALVFIDGIDNVVWNCENASVQVKDAYCMRTKHSNWTFADVRGSVQ